MRSEADKTVVVHLDGTLAKFEGWTGQFEPIGEPISDINGWSARDFMLALQRRGFQTIVYSSRGDVRAIEGWLEHFAIPYDAINCCLLELGEILGMSEKPIAIAYVDDRAVRFAGDYRSALVRVIQLAGKRERATAEQDGQDTATAPQEERQTAAQDGQDTAGTATADRGDRREGAENAENGNGDPIELEVSPAGEARLIAAKLRELVRELHGGSSREKMLLGDELQVIEDRIAGNGDRIVELQHDRDHWRVMAEALDEEDVFGDGG